MTFLTFLLYFFLSHLIYTLVMSGVAVLIERYKYNQQQRFLHNLLNNPNVKVVTAQELQNMQSEEKWDC